MHTCILYYASNTVHPIILGFSITRFSNYPGINFSSHSSATDAWCSSYYNFRRNVKFVRDGQYMQLVPSSSLYLWSHHLLIKHKRYLPYKWENNPFLVNQPFATKTLETTSNAVLVSLWGKHYTFQREEVRWTHLITDYNWQCSEYK